MRMKRKVRNVICFLLAIVMIAQIYPVYAEEEYNYTDANGVDYVYTDTGVLLSVEGVVGALDLTEMATAKNITIKAIGNGAFQYCSTMTSVNLPASVEIISPSAFYNCSSLSEITYEEGSKLTTIGDFAFTFDSLLTDFHQEGTVANGSFNFPEGLTRIGSYAFESTSPITATIPEKVSIIGESAFEYSETLTVVNIKNDSVVIQVDAFLSTVIIYANEGSTGQAYATANGNTFEQLPQDQEPATTTTQVPATTTTQVPATTTTQVPATTTTQTSTVQTPKQGEKYTVGGLIYKAASESTVVFLKPAKKSITKLVVPDYVTIKGHKYAVTGISAKACYNLKKLKNVKIGNRVSTIGKQAFANCKKLQKITIGTALTKIGENCFRNDKKLKTVTIKSKKLKKVGKNCMRGTSKKKFIVPQTCISKYKLLFSTAK
ncbi:MAG: leucine-rich repeat domain-containing protein [Lachnospiraceae bacterium]|nr:leucine-rich repeat domain-containing protein [Lachnospiraceae bacterium]